MLDKPNGVAQSRRMRCCRPQPGPSPRCKPKATLRGPSLMALTLAAACAGGEEAAGSESAVRARPVRAQRAQVYRGERASLFPGRVRSESQPAVSFRVPGRIIQLRVDVGDRVRPGQLLAQLDPSDYRTRVDEAKAAVAQARAEAKRTQRTADRNARLFAGNAISEAAFDQSQDVAEAAAAQLASAEERLKLAQQELSYTKLNAPEAGVVVARPVDPGTNVRAGDPVVQLSGDRIEVRVDLPETALKDVRLGAEAQVRLPALEDRFRSARVVRISSGTARRQLLYPVFLRLTDDGARPVPGMSAEVQMPQVTELEGDLVSVPPTAVVGDPEGTFVWLLEPDEGSGSEPDGSAPTNEGDDGPLYRARRQSVSLAKLTGRAAVLSSGVGPEQQVVTAGVHYLSDGQRVRIARLPPLVEDDVVVEQPRTTVGVSVDEGGR